MEAPQANQFFWQPAEGSSYDSDANHQHAIRRKAAVPLMAKSSMLKAPLLLTLNETSIE